MHIFFTGPEARKSEIPFLLDASMQPITAANAWLQELAQDGATSSPCSWKTYAYHLFDYFSYLEAHHLDWRQVNNETVLQYRDVQDQNRSGHTKEHLNRRTINARIRTVGRFYAFAFEQGFIEKNPIKYKKLSFRRRNALCWSEAQLRKLTISLWGATDGRFNRDLSIASLIAFPKAVESRSLLTC